MHYWHRIYTPPHHFGMNKISSCKFIGGTGEGVFLIAMEMVPSAEVMSVGPSEMETTGGLLLHFLSHVNQLCLVQDRLVEGVVAVQGFVKSNDDVWDLVESHGVGH